MRTMNLLTGIAALALAGAAGAAEPVQKDGMQSSPPSSQQNAPAEKLAPSMHQGERKSPQTTGQAPGASEPGKARTNERREKSSTDLEKNGGPPSGKSRATDTPPGAARETHGSETGKGATTGQGTASGAAKLSTDQRTRITTILKRQNVERTRLNISVRVGAAVPSSVHVYPLPTEVVEVYPEWRGYDYILVGDEIIIVNPRNHLIVAVLEA
jgi:hypothetical protein